LPEQKETDKLLAYNIKRAINIIGTKKLIEAMQG
jgi:hypothetical protein